MGCTIRVPGIDAPAAYTKASRAFQKVMWSEGQAAQDEAFDYLCNIEAKCLNVFGPWDVDMSYGSWTHLAELCGLELSPEDNEACIWNMEVEPFLRGLQGHGLQRALPFIHPKFAHFAHAAEQLMRKAVERGLNRFQVM